jgi:uncharacterized protein
VFDIERDDESVEFFDGTTRGELMIKRCNACGHYLRPDAIVCTQCHDDDLVWTAASGRASLVSWIVVHRAEAEPAVVGLVELEEGPWLHTGLVDVDRAQLAVGDALEVGFERAGDEYVPIFRPA